MILSIPAAFAENKTINCEAITDKTSILILLNSSKQIQEPQLAKPLKKAATATKSVSYEQLYTTHCLAILFAKSLVDSVLPVPAGPAGAPPILNLIAPIRVK